MRSTGQVLRRLRQRRRVRQGEPRCSSCGDPVLEGGLGDPESEVVCLACAIVLQSRCTQGDEASCARIRELNELSLRAGRPPQAS